MADTTYLMCQPFLRSIFDQGFLYSDQESRQSHYSYYSV